MAFIFEWNSTQSTPSPRSTRLAPAFRRTTRERFLRRSQDQQVRRRGRQGRLADAGPAPIHRLPQHRRHVGGVPGSCPPRVYDLADPDRVQQLERTKLPSEAPLHHPVHVVDRVSDQRRHARGVDERRCQRLAQKRPDPVRAGKERAHPLTYVLDRLRHLQGASSVGTASGDRSWFPDRAQKSAPRGRRPSRVDRSPGRSCRPATHARAFRRADAASGTGRVPLRAGGRTGFARRAPAHRGPRGRRCGRSRSSAGRARDR